MLIHQIEAALERTRLYLVLANVPVTLRVMSPQELRGLQRQQVPTKRLH